MEDVFILHIENSHLQALIVFLPYSKECMRETEAERNRERIYAIAYWKCTTNCYAGGR